tara:strand:- start:13069 stop:13347 length:279 start_codon:yes stop_codon:yes gene_type:complete
MKEKKVWKMKQYAENHCAVLLDKCQFLPIVADIYTGPEDAALVSAAPELLSALQKLLSVCDDGDRRTKETALELAKAAVTKAMSPVGLAHGT